MNTRPSLLCLNLQRDFLEPSGRFIPRAYHTLPNALSCLSWARRLSLQVTHILTRSDTLASPRPIQGFHPRPDEIVATKSTASLFDAQHVAETLAARGGAFVVGFSGDRDCLAAAFDAQRYGVRLMFVTDAIASSAFSQQAPEQSDALVGEMLSRLAAATTTIDLLQRETGALTHGGKLLLSTTGGNHERQ